MKKFIIIGLGAIAAGYFLAPQISKNKVGMKVYSFGANGFKP